MTLLAWIMSSESLILSLIKQILNESPKGPSTFVVANPVKKSFQEGNLSSSDVLWFIISLRFLALTMHELMLHLNKKNCFILNNCPFTTKFNPNTLIKPYKFSGTSTYIQLCQKSLRNLKN